MSTAFQHLLVQHDERVVTITMNRPEVLNAINERMLHELIEAVESASQDEQVRCIVLAGAGRAFGAGQDLAELAVASSGPQPLDVAEHLGKYHRLVQALYEAPKPVIASIQGIAAGISLNIALACDMRIACDDARFRMAFARIGLVPDGGGAYFLPRLVGLSRALEMALLAEDVTAPQAERLGMINSYVTLTQLAPATQALARRLANGPTSTYGLIKKLFYTSAESDLQTVLKLEGELQQVALQTADHREGVSAFLQKRTPEYPGK